MESIDTSGPRDYFVQELLADNIIAPVYHEHEDEHEDEHEHEHVDEHHDAEHLEGVDTIPAC